jgi:hypothetical protein
VTRRALLAGAGALVATLAVIAAIGALLLGQRGREDLMSKLRGREPLESGRYCNRAGDCWDVERGEPATVWLVTPGGARFGEGIRARPSPYRDWDFEIDHQRGRLQFLVMSPRTINIREVVDAKPGDFDVYGRR